MLAVRGGPGAFSFQSLQLSLTSVRGAHTHTHVRFGRGVSGKGWRRLFLQQPVRASARLQAHYICRFHREKFCKCQKSVIGKTKYLEN